MNFGFLSTIDAPLLPLSLCRSLEQGVKDIVVICDSKLQTEKDARIWVERTAGNFDKREEGATTIYNLSGAPIPFYFVDNHNSAACRQLIEELSIDCLVNAGTPRKLNKDILGAAEVGVVNVHPGILPEYRGACAVEWAILNDDRVGNTAHFMTEAYDAGKVIASEWYEFPKDADYPAIRVKVYEEGCRFLAKVLRSIQYENVRDFNCLAQDEARAILRKPLSDNEMQEVYRVLVERKYKYQCL